MLPVEVNFIRPQECPIVKISLWSERQKEFISVSALIDTGAALNVVNFQLWSDDLDTLLISGYKKSVGGFGGSETDVELTAVRLRIGEQDFKYVGFYVGDLDYTNYDAILGMPFLKNFDFTFRLNTAGAYHGKLILNPLVKSSALVELRNFNPESSKFGIYYLQGE